MPTDSVSMVHVTLLTTIYISSKFNCVLYSDFNCCHTQPWRLFLESNLTQNKTLSYLYIFFIVHTHIYIHAIYYRFNITYWRSLIRCDDFPGANGCSNNSYACKHFCMPLANMSYRCLCPDHMAMSSTGACLEDGENLFFFSLLSPFILAVVVDVVTEFTREGTLSELLYDDNNNNNNNGYF